MSVPMNLLGMLLQGAGPQPTMPGIMLPPEQGGGGFVAQQPSSGLPSGGYAPTQAPQAPMPPGARLPTAGGGILERLKGLMADPNFRMALLQTGTGMMRTPRFGESGWDVAGESIQRGAMTLQALREQDRRQKEQEGDKAFDREIKTAGVENDKARTGAYTKATDAQAKASDVATQSAEIDLKIKQDPAYQDRVKRLEDLGLDKAEAEVAATKALTRERNSAASLRDRTDPNLQSDGSGGAGGFDVQAANAAAEELMRNNPQMTREQARAQAFGEQTKAKRTSTDVAAMQKAVSDRAQAIAFGLVPATPEEKADPYGTATRQVIAERQQMLGQDRPDQVMARAAIATSKYKGKTFKTDNNGQATVVGPDPSGRIKVLVVNPDGTQVTGFVTPEQLDAEMTGE